MYEILAEVSLPDGERLSVGDTISAEDLLEKTGKKYVVKWLVDAGRIVLVDEPAGKKGEDD